MFHISKAKFSKVNKAFVALGYSKYMLYFNIDFNVST